MKSNKSFATIAQRQAWQAECERNAAQRMLRRLMRQVSRQARELVLRDQRRLAQEFRDASAAHVKALQRERDERVRVVVDERQLELV
jgi:hypothetical protein